MRPMISLCALALTAPPLLATPVCAQDLQYAAITDKPTTSRNKVAPAGQIAFPKPVMVRIEPGQFFMGSPQYEEKRDANEGPVQAVTISYPFEVSQYEVTFRDWAACVSAGGCRGHRPNDKGWGRGHRPVINVSWDDAKAYIRWLNKATGLRYRLLSEAEWEYIARAGRAGPFGTGDSLSSQQANFNGGFPYGNAPTGAYLKKTKRVGSYGANDFGLFDVHGNVYEWVEDCWNNDHRGAPNDGSARLSGDCKYRIMRGGSWVTHGYQMRAAKRLRYTTDYRYDDYGFRIARTLAK